LLVYTTSSSMHACDVHAHIGTPLLSSCAKHSAFGIDDQLTASCSAMFTAHFVVQCNSTFHVLNVVSHAALNVYTHLTNMQIILEHRATKEAHDVSSKVTVADACRNMLSSSSSASTDDPSTDITQPPAFSYRYTL
jgi:hypothetical protein